MKKHTTADLNMDAIQQDLNRLGILTSKRKLEVIKSAMEILSPIQKQYLDEWMMGDSMVEIAKRHGVNKSSVSRGISRSIKKIKYLLAYTIIYKIED